MAKENNAAAADVPHLGETDKKELKTLNWLFTNCCLLVSSLAEILHNSLSMFWLTYSHELGN